MELGTFAKKRLRSFAVVFILVIAIEADIFSTWYHGPNEDTIKTYIAREVLGQTVKDEWRQWKQKGVFTEATVNNVKEVTFSPTAREPLGKILGYLNYFPLLEEKNVIYNIPVDGRQMKLKLIHDKNTEGAFKANYLYTDASGQHETRLTNSKRIMQELIANTKDYPKLRQALRFAMPEILKKDIRKTGTFDGELRTATSGSATTIPNAVKDKAYRNALEAMLSTSVMRKSPETWIAKASSEVKAQTSNLKISMENVVEKQWKSWRKKGYFSEKTDAKTGIKKVTFSKGLSISPIEIFHSLQYFRNLEKGAVKYSIPIDGVPFEFEFAPKGSNDFTVKSVRKDQYGIERKTDISVYSSLRKAIDKDVYSTDKRELGLAIHESFPKIFNNPMKNNPKDLFKQKVKEETRSTGVSVQSNIQENVFRNTVDLLAASIMIKKPIPKIYWMSTVYENIKSKVEIQDSKIRSKATVVAAKKSWETMGNKYTQTNTSPKEITFKTDAGLTVKDIFDHLRHFAALESQPVIYKFPIDGENVRLKLAPDGNGGFTAKYLYDDATGQTLETDLTKTEDIVHDLMGTTQGQRTLSSALESSVPKIFQQKLADTGKFTTELNNAISKTAIRPNIPNDLKQKALRQTLEAIASMSLMGDDGKTWVDRMDNDMERKRAEVEKSLNEKIIDKGRVTLKHELALSLTESTNEIKEKWKQLKDLGYIETHEDSATGLVQEIKINNDIPYTLKDTFRLLQRFHDVYPNQGHNRAEVTIPIGGEDRKFDLSIGTQGANQLLIESRDRYWKGSTETPGKTGNELIKTGYKEMLDRGLRSFDSATLADTMLEAIHSRLNDQPGFSNQLKIKQGADPPKQTKDLIRGTVEFLLTTMIAEASNPPNNVRDNFNDKLVSNINRKRKHPSLNEMPHLNQLTDARGNNLKEGRSPTADLVAIKLLEKIRRTGKKFDRVFKDTPNRYPFMQKKGGTAAGRQYLFAHGDDQIPSTVILEEAAGDHDGETIAKRARLSCTGSKKRRKRQTCSLEEVNDHMMVDDKSIKVEDSKVELELVDRRDATKRKRLTIPITSEDLATPKVIQQKIANSERAVGSSKYAKVNRGLAVHGLIFSAIGAIDYFQRGDNVHGGIAVSQSLHTLGGLTGFNEIASKAAKQVLRHAAFKVARGLNMEKGLERFSLKVEKYMEKGVGKLMGDLPGVGLAFDIYFIEQDIEALSNLDLNNPEDVKMLPLRVVDLVLDIDTTVLNLIGTFCPEAEVITEPLIIVLSIVRMAIDDFYVDIMEEMDKVNWNSPWAGFEFIGALFKGILEGAADFLSGGLRRQMDSYSKQEKADRQLISSLKDATSYYKITGKKGEKTIDFTQGKLSSFGGFITFRMCDDGMAHLEIGDVTGNHETVTKTFRIDHDVKDIVLGIGESREFLYETKTAKLWAFIPIKHYRVIKNANLKSYSLFGTYYGNNKGNKFYAVQDQKKQKQKDHRQCDYGKIDIGFVTGRYHYNLYGRGGDDLFYLGPQMSKVTGGKGSDVYIVQSYGGNTIIDNFAEDNKRDMVIVNVPYDDISCTKNGEDLDILYRNTHHIRITHWFVPGNTKYYRHISFKSKDGIIFLAKDIPSGTTCRPVAIAKGNEKQGQHIATYTAKFSEVKQIVGTDFDDRIYGNDLNNLIDGGKGRDYLKGGKSEDTYIIRAGEGCDTIDNYASDYKKTTDVVIFNVKYERIRLQTSGMDLKLYDSTNAKSCVIIHKWLEGDEYRHMIFTSLDHLVFKIKESNSKFTKFPMVLDYSSSTKGVKVSLVDGKLKGFIYSNGFKQVATVSDSKYSDTIIGNDQSNFLSCTGGNDQLFGGPGSDNYIVKKSCGLATIVNLDKNKKVDLLLLDYKFEELTLTKKIYDLVINYKVNQPKVILISWFILPEYRHLWVRSKDGVTLRINTDKLTLEPVEISKDPEECLCKGSTCQPQHIKYDLSIDPWKTVTRFQLKSSLCSYKIRGNDLNNYIDPGSGNGYTYQRLRGGNGADTYVLKHGYGEFNVINNIASDNKNDTLKLGLEASDINFRFYRKNDVILASKTRPKSLTVRLRHYFKGPEYQHLLVTTTDEVTFQIQKEHPFMTVISVDMSQFVSPQHPTVNQMVLSSVAQSVKGTHNYPNTILGTSSTKEIEGGFKDDILTGGSGDNIIKGRQGDDKLFGRGGDDIIFGGDGNDFIKGGDGNDYIYGGNGRDEIDGGEGGDAICFKGDGFDKKGVYIDLSGGFGKSADAEGDKYTSIEHVYGTIHDDTLIGSDSDNNLHGMNGNDVLISKGGDDQLIGGDGKDRYILDNAYGIKTIDNYAKDNVKDTLSLANTHSEDVCVFLVEDDLHLQVKQKSLTSLLYQKRPLSVIVLNWNKLCHFRHLNILFKDTFWPSRALEKVKQHIHQKKAIVEQTEKQSSFALTSGVEGGLSWKPYQQLRLDEETQFELLQYDLDNPQNTKQIDLPNSVIAQGSFTIPNFTRNKHYIFALLMKYCSAIIAKSYSLTYLGEKRPCSAINVPNLQITYKTPGSYIHESQASLTCSQGYKFKMSDMSLYIVTCVDGTWQAKLPTCIPKAKCPNLNEPSNGEVRQSEITLEGEFATYICDRGFQLAGSKQRRCGEDGKWAGEEPKCERINCFQVPKVKHGKLTECNGRSKIYGTLQSPKHNFCFQLVCDANYVEQWRMDTKARQFEKLLSASSRSKWFCRGSRWKGPGKLACISAVRLTQKTSTWYTDNGVIQEWDDVNARWKNSLSRDTKKHRLACANSVGMENYDGRLRVLSANSQSLRIACLRIRFAEMITPYEGKLETLIQGKWHRTCMVGPDYRTKLRPVYQRMCTDMGVAFDKPGVGAVNNGPTTHLIRCSRESSDINACSVETYSIANCASLLQCKRRCNNDYSVANGQVQQCTGKFEGDTCQVVCTGGYRLIGPSKVYCTNGEWSDQRGRKATSRCER